MQAVVPVHGNGWYATDFHRFSYYPAPIDHAKDQQKSRHPDNGNKYKEGLKNCQYRPGIFNKFRTHRPFIIPSQYELSMP